MYEIEAVLFTKNFKPSLKAHTATHYLGVCTALCMICSV